MAQSTCYITYDVRGTFCTALWERWIFPPELFVVETERSRLVGELPSRDLKSWKNPTEPVEMLPCFKLQAGGDAAGTHEDSVRREECIPFFCTISKHSMDLLTFGS